jgi:hypothetical protein
MATKQQRGSRLGAQRLRDGAASREGRSLRPSTSEDNRENRLTNAHDARNGPDPGADKFGEQRESHAAAIMRRAEEIVAARRTLTEASTRAAGLPEERCYERGHAEAGQVLAARGAAILERIRQRRAEARRLLEEHEQRLQVTGTSAAVALAASESQAQTVTEQRNALDYPQRTQHLGIQRSDTKQAPFVKPDAVDGRETRVQAPTPSHPDGTRTADFTESVSLEAAEQPKPERSTVMERHRASNSWMSPHRLPPEAAEHFTRNDASERDTLKTLPAGTIQRKLFDINQTERTSDQHMAAEGMAEARQLRTRQESPSWNNVRNEAFDQRPSSTSRSPPSTTRIEEARLPSASSSKQTESRRARVPPVGQTALFEHPDEKHAGGRLAESRKKSLFQQSRPSSLNTSMRDQGETSALELFEHRPIQSPLQKSQHSKSNQPRLGESNQRNTALGTETAVSANSMSIESSVSGVEDEGATVSGLRDTDNHEAQRYRQELHPDCSDANTVASPEKHALEEWEALKLATHAGSADDSWLLLAPNERPSFQLPATQAEDLDRCKQEGKRSRVTDSLEASRNIVDHQRGTRCSVDSAAMDRKTRERFAEEPAPTSAFTDSRRTSLSVRSNDPHETGVPCSLSKPELNLKVSNARYPSLDPGGDSRARQFTPPLLLSPGVHHQPQSRHLDAQTMQTAPISIDINESNRLYETALDCSDAFLEAPYSVAPLDISTWPEQPNDQVDAPTEKTGGGNPEEILPKKHLSAAARAEPSLSSDPLDVASSERIATSHARKPQGAGAYQPESVTLSEADVVELSGTASPEAESEQHSDGLTNDTTGIALEKLSMPVMLESKVVPYDAPRCSEHDETVQLESAFEMLPLDTKAERVSPVTAGGLHLTCSPQGHSPSRMDRQLGLDQVSVSSDVRILRENTEILFDENDSASEKWPQREPLTRLTPPTEENEMEDPSSTPRSDISLSTHRPQATTAKSPSMPHARDGDTATQAILEPSPAEERDPYPQSSSAALDPEHARVEEYYSALPEYAGVSVTAARDHLDSMAIPGRGDISLALDDDGALVSDADHIVQASAGADQQHIPDDIHHSGCSTGNPFPPTLMGGKPSVKLDLGTVSAEEMATTHLASFSQGPSSPVLPEQAIGQHDWESTDAASLQSKRMLWGTIAEGAAFFSRNDAATAYPLDCRETVAKASMHHDRETEKEDIPEREIPPHQGCGAIDRNRSGTDRAAMLEALFLPAEEDSGSPCLHRSNNDARDTRQQEESVLKSSVERSFAAPDELLVFDAVDANGTPVGIQRIYAQASEPGQGICRESDVEGVVSEHARSGKPLDFSEEDVSPAASIASRFDAVAADTDRSCDGKPLCPTAAFSALGYLAVSAPRVLQDLPGVEGGMSISEDAPPDEHPNAGNWSDHQLNTDVHVYHIWPLVAALDGVDVDVTALAHWPGPFDTLSDPVSEMKRFGACLESAWARHAPEDCASRVLCRFLTHALADTAAGDHESQAASTASQNSSPCVQRPRSSHREARTAKRVLLPFSNALQVHLQQWRSLQIPSMKDDPMLMKVETALIQGRYKTAVETAHRAGDWTLALLLSEAHAGLWPPEAPLTSAEATPAESPTLDAEDQTEDDESESSVQQIRLQTVRHLLDTGYAQNSPVALLLAVMIADEHRIQALAKHLVSPAGGSWPWQALLAGLWMLSPWQRPPSPTHRPMPTPILSKAFVAVAKALTSPSDSLDVDRMMLFCMVAAEPPWTASLTDLMEMAVGQSSRQPNPRYGEKDAGLSLIHSECSTCDVAQSLWNTDGMIQSSPVPYRLLIWEMYQTLWQRHFSASNDAWNDPASLVAMRRTTSSLYANLTKAFGDIGRTTQADQYRAMIEAQTDGPLVRSSSNRAALMADAQTLHARATANSPVPSSWSSQSNRFVSTPELHARPDTTAAGSVSLSPRGPATNSNASDPHSASPVSSGKERSQIVFVPVTTFPNTIAARATTAGSTQRVSQTEAKTIQSGIGKATADVDATDRPCSATGASFPSISWDNHSNWPPGHGDTPINEQPSWSATTSRNPQHSGAPQEREADAAPPDRTETSRQATCEHACREVSTAEQDAHPAATIATPDSQRHPWDDDAAPEREPTDPEEAHRAAEAVTYTGSSAESPNRNPLIEQSRLATTDATNALHHSTSDQANDATSPPPKATVSKGASRLRQLQQRLLGGWRSRKQANLGLENKFYYDEKLGRWICADDESSAENAAAGLTPPPSDTELTRTPPASNTAPAPSTKDDTQPSGAPSIPTPTNLVLNQGAAPAQSGPFRPQHVRQRYVDVLGAVQQTNASTDHPFSGGAVPATLLVRPPPPTSLTTASTPIQPFIPTEHPVPSEEHRSNRKQ